MHSLLPYLANSFYLNESKTKFGREWQWDVRVGNSHRLVSRFCSVRYKLLDQKEFFLSMTPQSMWLQPPESERKTQAPYFSWLAGVIPSILAKPLFYHQASSEVLLDCPFLSAAHLHLILTTLPHYLSSVLCFLQCFTNFTSLTSLKSVPLVFLPYHPYPYPDLRYFLLVSLKEASSGFSAQYCLANLFHIL